MTETHDQKRHAELVEQARRIGVEVAAVHAEDVDKNARFPAEAIQALRSAHLLSAFVPLELGGRGASVSDLSAICTELGRHCSATAMIFAMHQIQVACIVRHGRGVPFFDQYLRDLTEHEWLIASATSELGIGGDTRTSLCYVAEADGEFSLEKNASVISYGSHTDDILVTARKNADAVAGDQVLALVRRAQFSLEQTSTWDTLGMRGTCSFGFKLRGKAPLDHILPPRFADISAQSMLPISHIVWTSIWLGVASGAVSRARAFVRAEARKKPGTTPPSALRLAETMNNLHTLAASVRNATAEYERRKDDPEALSSLGFVVRMNNLKIGVSEIAVQVASQCLSICGINGYKSDSKFAVGRYLRDAYGAGVMIANDRLYGTNATLLLVSKED